MPPEITRLTTAFLKDPTRIEASRPAMTADTITQYLVRIPTSDPKAKRTALRALIERSEIKNGIVFCNRKSEVDIVAKSLQTHGFDAAAIHGDLDQSHRMKTLASFRSGDLKILVASDVAARGLDIPDVSHVFNYDVSHHADDYVHRIGRTGRAGRKGEAYMIVTPADDKSLDKVLKLIKKEPEELVLDGIDFAAINDGPKRDSGRGGRERSGERGRGRTRGATPVEAVEVAPATPVQDAEAPRSRSRRKARPEADVASASTPIQAQAPVETPVAPEAVEATEAPRPARSDREPHLLQSDRRGDRKPAKDDAKQQGVRGFGDDIPAFLRRPVIVRA